MEDQLLQLFENYLEHKPVWAIFIAFLGGLASSLSPCVLSILPIVIGYIGGYKDNKMSKAFGQSLLFSLGLIIVLTAIGVFSALAGQIIGSFIGPFWFIALGIIAVVMGLSLLEVFYIPFPVFIKDMPENKYGSLLYPIILGMAFGVIATPCSTPILLSLVSYVAYEKSILFGVIMLISYALGHSIILIIGGTFTGTIKQMCRWKNWTTYITKGSGLMLILVGIYLILHGIFPNIIVI